MNDLGKVHKVKLVKSYTIKLSVARRINLGGEDVIGVHSTTELHPQDKRLIWFTVLKALVQDQVAPLV